MTGFTVTHGNYLDKGVDEFVARYPEEVKGISKEELNRYKRIYYQNNAPKRYLSLDFPNTVRRLGLTREDIDKLAKAVELLYKSRVYELDRLFGSVVSSVAKAGLIEESLIVFTADHGEALYRENALFKWHHGGQLAPEALQVPLIIRHPGSKRRPVRYEQVTRSIDVFPTMMGLSGLEVPKQVDGVDPSDAILGQKDPPELIAWVHTSLLPTIMLEEIKAYSLAYKYAPRTDPRLMWVGMRDIDMVFKLRLKENGEWGFEAFDWRRDPGELTDLYVPSDPTHQEVAQKLLKYKAAMMKGYGNVVYSPGGEKLEIPEEEAMEALRSLGYL